MKNKTRKNFILQFVTNSQFQKKKKIWQMVSNLACKLMALNINH